MTKYKPKRLDEVADKFLAFAVALKRADQRRDRIFVCGNCESLQSVREPSRTFSDEKKIVRCTICGEEIDWEGYSKTVYLKCPKCNGISYQSPDKYCRECTPKTELVEDKTVW